MSTRIMIKKTRLNFPYLFTPRPAQEDGQIDKYSVMLLIDKKDKKTIKQIRAAEEEAAEAGAASKFGGKVPSKLASIIHDADEDGSAEDYPERAGHLYMSVSLDPKYGKPGVVDTNVEPILDQSQVYSGVYANVSVTAFPYTFGKKKGISFGLNNVQILGYGDSLGGGKRAEEEFEAIELDEEDEALL